MTDFLTTIMARRLHFAHESATHNALQTLRKHAEKRHHHSLIRKLRSTPGPHIIAEIKKASPSSGEIVHDFDPVRIARAYAANGAAAISVLTEPEYFMGSLDDLAAVRAVVDLPLLRKDFISHPGHMLEAAANGADVVLLIVAGLTKKVLNDLYTIARDLDLETLVEVHTEPELEQALALPDAIIGVNSRNLKTLKTDLNIARLLIASIPTDRLAIAESGIRTADEVSELASRGYRGFLIGTSLLTHNNPGTALHALLHLGEQ